MSSKTKSIIQWSLAGLVGFIFIGSGFVKLSGTEDSLQMAKGLGISVSSLSILGVIEIIAAVLFLVPRTGVLGTLLLIAYMGGAMATHLVIGESFVFPAVIQAIIWIVACLRFPELPQRIFPGKV